MQKVCPPNLTMKTVELPGRGMRMSESLLEDAHAMADDVLGQIREEIKTLKSP